MAVRPGQRKIETVIQIKEHLQIKQMCDEQNISVSVWLRRLVRASLNANESMKLIVDMITSESKAK